MVSNWYASTKAVKSREWKVTASSALRIKVHTFLPSGAGDVASWLIKHADQPNVLDPLELTLKYCYAW